MSEMNQNEGIEDHSVGDATGVTQYRVSFPEAIRRFCTTYTSNGRASRSEYWWSLLFCFVLILGVSAIFGEDGIVTNIISLIVKIMGVLIGWRRMHDIGKSGWWFLVPVYNIWLLVQPSQLQENKFGKVPNTTPSGKNMVWNRVSWTIIGVSLVAFLFLGDGDSSEGSGSSQATRFDIKKMRDSDELWFEGTNRISVSKGNKYELQFEDSYIEVEPNLMIIPDDNILPLGMGRTSPEKSINYIYDGGDGLSGHRWNVDFVDDDYVIVRNVGSFSGEETYFHIETQDEYIDGQNLKPGFYTYRGREKVSLVNGSSVTMYSFKKRTDGFFEAFCAAVEYNEKATSAARDENLKRHATIYQRLVSKLEEEEAKLAKAEYDNVIARLNPFFIAECKKCVSFRDIKKRLHVSPAVSGKIKVGDAWSYLCREKLPKTIEEIESRGSTLFYKERSDSFWDAKRCLQNGDSPEMIIKRLFSPNNISYGMSITNDIPSCKYMVFTIVGSGDCVGDYHRRHSDWAGGAYFVNIDVHYNTPIFIIDKDEDADLVEIFEKEYVELTYGRAWGMPTFIRAFRDKYEPEAKRDADLFYPWKRVDSHTEGIQ